MTDRVGCRVFWGSHGCERPKGHDGPHLCLSCWTEDEDGWVGAPPYYGPDTRFYGEDAERLGQSGGSRRHTLAVIGTVAPWVVAVIGGVLLSIASRYWPESTVFIVGCVFAAFLGLVGVPVLVFSWAYLNRKDQT